MGRVFLIICVSGLNLNCFGRFWVRCILLWGSVI